MSYNVSSRDATSLVDASSNFDYAPLGSAYNVTKDKVVYASGMTPSVMSSLALQFPQGLQQYTRDITDPRRRGDTVYASTLDNLAPVNLSGDAPAPVGYPSLASAYKM